METGSSTKDLSLFFPQWQGSGRTNELYQGALALYRVLKEQQSFIEVPVEPVQVLAIEQNILGYAPLKRQLQEARRILQEQKPQRIFTLGGDCGIEVAPISYLNALYKGEIAVVWLDAHPDLNTPESSPSKTLHGMPLRMLMGEGDSFLVAQVFAPLQPSQVFLAGVRDLDVPEAQFVERHGISLFPCSQLANNLETLIHAIRKRGFARIYIHIDMDVLDPQAFPNLKYPTPQGLSMETLLYVYEALSKAFSVVGRSVVEIMPEVNGEAHAQVVALSKTLLRYS